jgi:hypothetical protein
MLLLACGVGVDKAGGGGSPGKGGTQGIVTGNEEGDGAPGIIIADIRHTMVTPITAKKAILCVCSPRTQSFSFPCRLYCVHCS